MTPADDPHTVLVAAIAALLVAVLDYAIERSPARSNSLVSVLVAVWRRLRQGPPPPPSPPAEDVTP